MDSIQNTVSYCCVSKEGRVLYTYNDGDNEIENMAALCLEMTPPYHQWYFQTMAKKTFGFLMDDGYVYFAIVRDNLGNSQVLKFLKKLREEFQKMGKKGSGHIMSNQLIPVIHQLVASLENVSKTGTNWPPNEENSPSPENNVNGHAESGRSTQAPLLGKFSKHEKKKMKDHVIGMRGIEMEEHRRSTERGVRADSGVVDSNGQGNAATPSRKEYNSVRSQNLQKKWYRQVKTVIAIDVAICIVLLGIWLVICRGIECTR